MEYVPPEDRSGAWRTVGFMLAGVVMAAGVIFFVTAVWAGVRHWDPLWTSGVRAGPALLFLGLYAWRWLRADPTRR